jgi:hypothetical protein
MRGVRVTKNRLYYKERKSIGNHERGIDSLKTLSNRNTREK